MACNSSVPLVTPVKGEAYSMVTGLLPCPFCGDENLLLKSQNGGLYFYLSCRVQSCLLGRTRAHRSVQKLFRFWNNRISKAVPMVSQEPPAKRQRSWLMEFLFGGS